MISDIVPVLFVEAVGIFTGQMFEMASAGLSVPVGFDFRMTMLIRFELDTESAGIQCLCNYVPDVPVSLLQESRSLGCNDEKRHECTTRIFYHLWLQFLDISWSLAKVAISLSAKRAVVTPLKLLQLLECNTRKATVSHVPSAKPSL